MTGGSQDTLGTDCSYQPECADFSRLDHCRFGLQAIDGPHFPCAASNLVAVQTFLDVRCPRLDHALHQLAHLPRTMPD
jgi:hypothetical protein